MSFRLQSSSIPAGTAGASRGSNAQCGSYSAPASIQRRIRSTSASVIARLPLSGGGMTSCGSIGGDALESRRDASGSPGTIAARPSTFAGGVGEGVESEVRHLGRGVRSVAEETPIRKDRSDVAPVAKGSLPTRRCRSVSRGRPKRRPRGGVGGGVTGDPRRDGENGNARCDDSLIGGSHTSTEYDDRPVEDAKTQDRSSGVISGSTRSERESQDRLFREKRVVG